MHQLVTEAYNELNKRIAPFWAKLRDEENKGFYGYVDFNLNVKKDAVKGVILNSRILWFFSNQYLLTKDEKMLGLAQNAHEFLLDHCLDKTYGGVYWSVNADGSVYDETKHIYNQAFVIYALAAYYEASKDEAALQLAFKQYALIEDKGLDRPGYLEAFSRDFSPVSNDKISDNPKLTAMNIIAKKSMNTLLHILEAYTELYRISLRDDVRKSLIYLLEIFRDYVYNPKKAQLEVFLDRNLKSVSDIHSYGHDIEATWLLDRACKVLEAHGTQELFQETRRYTGALAKNLLNFAFDGDALNNERFCNEVEKTKVWWVQTEGVIGYINLWQKTGDENDLNTAIRLWEYIKSHLIDPRPDSEWFWSVETDGKTTEKPIVEPWKCPYHNGRMCFEIIKRLS